MSALNHAIQRLRDHVIEPKGGYKTLYDLGDHRNLHDDVAAVVAIAADLTEKLAASNENASGAELIARERSRQVTEEDWSDYHDDCHKHGELADAAACYAVFGHSSKSDKPAAWPWANEWWKPEENRIRTLVKAGALIAAEIDRLLRLKKQEARG